MTVASVLWFVTTLIGFGYASSSSSSSSSDSTNSNDCPSPLNWDQDPWLPEENNDTQLTIPSLTQPFYNFVTDVRATVSAQDVELIFSTNGNWQFALVKLLDEKYFIENPSVKSSYLITTSPPISIAQMDSGLVKVGNIMYTDAQPHLVVGPGGLINAFEAGGYSNGESRIPIISTYGNVILKRKGDTLVNTFWDLRFVESGKFASSHPTEGGSYNNYFNSVYNIAVNNPRIPSSSSSSSSSSDDDTQDTIIQEALDLQKQLFENVASIGPPMHRSVPHMIATGEADAGLIFLHLAVFAMTNNPGVFEAVYLADDKIGSTDDPQILAQGQIAMTGNQQGTFFAIKTNTPLNSDQETATDNLIDDLLSDEFTDILTEVGLRRPSGF